MGDGQSPSNSQQTRRATAMPLPLPPVKQKVTEERRPAEFQRSQAGDRWTALRNYRKAKGLCFVCGEKWSKDQQCKASVQLHVVHEMIDHLQDLQPLFKEEPDEQGQVHMLCATINRDSRANKTILLSVTVQDTPMIILIDSRSTHSFINDMFA